MHKCMVSDNLNRKVSWKGRQIGPRQNGTFLPQSQIGPSHESSLSVVIFVLFAFSRFSLFFHAKSEVVPFGPSVVPMNPNWSP